MAAFSVHWMRGIIKKALEATTPSINNFRVETEKSNLEI